MSRLSTFICLLLGLVMVTQAAESQTPPSADEVKALAGQGVAWMIEQQQEDGAFIASPVFRLGITSVSTLALLDYGKTIDDAPVARAVAFIRQFVQDDGGIYNPAEGLGSYNTSLATLVLLRTGTAKDDPVIIGAQNYLIGAQNTDPESINYGGIGYGSRGGGNEDLNNTAYAVEALAASGLGPDHPAMQRALQFISRCQNLYGHNDREWAGEDSGGVYSPDSSKAGGSYHDGHSGEDPADRGTVGHAVRLESYGTMTYNLITSFLYLQLDREDPRLNAAFDWVTRNYSFDRNPGLAEELARQGLFYYYTMMAKTWNMVGATTIDLPDGRQVDWRRDLFEAIRERMVQRDNAAIWVNEARRWGEGFPNLVTPYMVSSLMRIHESVSGE